MREVKAKVGKMGTGLKVNRVDWSVTACLFVDDTVLLAESKRELQIVVDQFHNVCSRRKLRVNAEESKVMVFESREVEMVDFGNPYRVSVPEDERCETVMGGERMEVVKETKYLGTVLSKHRKMEEVRERAVKGRSVIVSQQEL